MTVLGDDWQPDHEGIPRRDGARVVVFDQNQRVLMIKGHDAHDPSAAWWFTVGGGLERDEDARVGAARELVEETGIAVNPRDLVGPVLFRQADFRFMSVRARQDELFYLAHYEGDPDAVTTEGFTEIERQTLEELRWFTVEELQELSKHERIYPRVLPDLIEKWLGGWDGTLTEIVDVTYADPKTGVDANNGEGQSGEGTER